MQARFRGEPALSLLTRLRKKAKILDSTFTPALPHLPLHSCLLSPTVPYSIPLLGSSLVRTSTSLSSRPLSCVLCLVHLRPTARKAYPDWIDRVHQFPKGYKVPEFVLFSGEEKKSTIEHIARFSVQCGEARSKDYLKLRLFANSLTKSAFPWYMNIPPNSINSWYDLESKFHEQFYRTDPDIQVANLARLTQLQRSNREV